MGVLSASFFTQRVMDTRVVRRARIGHLGDFMKMMIVALLFAGTAVASAQGQMASAPSGGVATTSTQSMAPVKNPVAASVRTIQPNRQKNILGAIEAMPEDKFGYKPTPEQMTFGHLVVHIVESNYGMCSKIADVAAPKIEELKETDAKEKLLAAARASFDYCTSTLANVDDSKLGDNVDFGRIQGPRAMAAFFLTGGWADHYGAAAIYLRLNGILPPSAQTKK